MSTNVSLQTIDGRVVNGINFTVNQATIPASVPALAASMPGQMTMGVYHIKTPHGWEYIPASQLAAVLQVKAGAPT